MAESQENTAPAPQNQWTISDPDSLMAAGGDLPLNNTEYEGQFDVGGATMSSWQDGADLAMFTRISSNEIIYRSKQKQCKLVGRYIVGDLLGEGAFGKVKECIDKDTLERRAVKIFKRKKLKRKLNGEQNLQREIKLLKRLRHRNILKLYDVLHNNEKQKIYMILEFCVCQLKEMLDNAHKKRFPLWQAHRYFLQLMDGVEYLHSQRVVHNDIKPANLLLSSDMTVKLCDLGTAEQLDIYSNSDMISSSQGSPAFQPPEIAAGHEQFSGFKVDVWSCGVTLYNFVTGEYPFEGDTVFKLYDAISSGHFVLPDHLSDHLASLLRGMLDSCSESRLSVAKIRQHEWCRKRQPRTTDHVPVPARDGDELHSLTVLPYIWHKHFGSDDQQQPALSSTQYQQPRYITERQLNDRESISLLGDCSSTNTTSHQHQQTSNMSHNSSAFRSKSWSSCRQS